MSARPDTVTLVAGLAVALLGGILLAAEAGSVELTFGWLFAALAAALGAILLASGLTGRDR